MKDLYNQQSQFLKAKLSIIRVGPSKTNSSLFQELFLKHLVTLQKATLESIPERQYVPFKHNDFFLNSLF